jgi:hypothetical protein
MNTKKKVFIVGGVVVLCLVILWISLANPLLKAVTHELGSQELTLISPLANWIRFLGAPSEVALKGGQKPFCFYWPEHGVAVVAHPHYQAQYRRRPFSEWKVTAIIVPVKAKVRLLSDSDIVEFSKLLPIKINGRGIQRLEDIKRIFFTHKAIDEMRVEVGNKLNPLMYSQNVVYLNNNSEVETVRISRVNIFEWYD